MSYVEMAIETQHDVQNAMDETTTFSPILGMRGMSSSFTRVTSSLKQLDAISDSTANSLQLIGAGLQTIVAMTTVYSTARAIMESYKTKQQARAVAETAMHTVRQNYIGIGIAVGSALLVSSTVIVTSYALSDPVGRGNVLSTIGGILHGR